MPNPNYDYLQQHPLIEIINVNWGVADVGILEFGREFPTTTPPPALNGHRPTIFRFIRPACGDNGEAYAGTYELDEFGFPPPEAHSWVGEDFSTPLTVQVQYHGNSLFEAVTEFDDRVDPWDGTFNNANPILTFPNSNTILPPNEIHYNALLTNPENFWGRYVWALGYFNGVEANVDTYLINFRRMRDAWKAVGNDGRKLIDPDHPLSVDSRKPLKTSQFWWATGIETAFGPFDPPQPLAGKIQIRFRAFSGIKGKFVPRPEGRGCDYISRPDAGFFVSKLHEEIRNVTITSPFMQGRIIYNFARTVIWLDEGPVIGAP